MWPTILAGLALAGLAHANDPAPVAFEASEWLGIDGNWSSVQFLLGSPPTGGAPQLVNVLVSTSLSEFWAIGTGGCHDKESHCIAARGQVYDPYASKNWHPMGTWQLGLEYLGVTQNGQYGLDSLNSYSSITDNALGMSNVIIAAVNTTDYFTGFFGLGNIEGRFGNQVANSPLTQAVSTFGWIPSYSYGYTAGAHYRNTPVSVTLGGVDTVRYVEHNTDFTLDRVNGVPSPLVRGIQATAKDQGYQLSEWNSSTEIFSSWDTSFTAIIDSTTPYMWLPDEVCDRFVNALGLTYNSTFDLYTLTDEQYRDYTQPDSISFTFTLSSFDNNDDFGYPLDVPGAVNITVPIEAFVGLLSYPFMDEIKYLDSAVPYFMLKKTQSNSTAIIGRSFMQEAYLITKYDEAIFSIHQAKFPGNAQGDAELVAIKQPNNSPLPGPPTPEKHKGGLSKWQMVGIAAGIVLFCIIVVVGWCCYRRRKKTSRGKAASVLEDNKDTSSTLASDSSRTPVQRILSKIVGRKRSRRTDTDASDAATHPSEAPDSEIYELPVPVPPVELDCGGDDDSMDGTEMGTDNSHQISAYELARRKMDRQLQGPVPAYSPPEEGNMPPPEKMVHDMSPLPPEPGRNLADQLSPMTPRFPPDVDSNSLPISVPSPVSPRMDWNSNSTDLPSPVTVSGPRSASSDTRRSRGPTGSPPGSAHSGSNGHGTMRSNSSATTPASPSSVSLPPPPSSFQRTPIDPSKVVCLGPLPENVQAPRMNLTNRPGRGDGGRRYPAGKFKAESLPSEDSLGSNYTEEEERIVEEMTRQVSLSVTRSNESRDHAASPQERQPQRIQTQDTQSPRHQVSGRTEPDSPSSQERIDGMEFVHVPQLAERRYSWEEEREK